ncbi:glycosyl hydrolase family 28-related protein [Streptomyces avicenniae]|uniref:glycosyl hydrolase family 28-related protein n=1 Tax=Streptomyces avicenniae TaxID=500153 RepID=UPI00069AFECA|nr:glycosyl hydrolase family 28-related protein [Streptomyces avicenniae]
MTGTRERPSAAPPTRRRRAEALLAAVTSLALLGSGAGTALASGGNGSAPAPVVTRAALDPALVTGRGADVPFLEQEAENAATTGTVLAPDRTPYTLPSEASGRSAVSLAPGQYVEFTLPEAANAVTVRYSIPDAADGGGITAPLDVTVRRDGSRVGPARHLTLTSEYSWLYNQYPFTNDPQADLLHPDWWLTECDCVPAATDPAPVIEKPFRPTHMYDEQRLLLGRTYQAGDTVRLTAPPGTNAEWTVIDLIDTEKVAPPRFLLRAANVLAFGADPTGRRDAAPAIERAIAFAQRADLPVYLPPGVFKVNRHIVVDDVTIRGAGNWYTIIRGEEVPLDEPLPDGSTHTGVGFYGRYAEDGGSSDVHLADFAIEGDVAERIDTDQVNAIGGVLNDSTVRRLYLTHTKVGLWFDGPMDNFLLEDTVIVNQIADALNFHRGVTDSVARGNFVRNTGDDGLAMWSEPGNTNARNSFVRNTVQSPTLANGIAIYGGTDITVEGNLVADPVREGSGLHAGSRFGADPFGGRLAFTDNTVVRGGTLDLNWDIGLGAIWFYALERDIDADIRVTGDHYLDSTYNAIMLVTEFAQRNEHSIENAHFRDIRVDGTGTSVLSARTAGSATFENVDARHVGAVGINNCGAFNFPATGSEFSVLDGGGNDGGGTTGPWFGAWQLPNTLTCDDRPPVVAPPAPSPW